MALSFKEKRTLQKVVDGKQKELKAGDLPFKEKRAAQKAMKDAFDRLKAKVDLGAENQKLKDLIAGKYNKKPATEFIVILDEIVTEIGDLEPVKEPTIAYVEENMSNLLKAAA